MILPSLLHHAPLDQIGARLVLVGFLTLLAGCDRVFVNTEATYPKVDVACVDRAVRGVPGIAGVVHGHKVEQAGAARAVSHIWTYKSDEPAYLNLTYAAPSWTFASSAMAWAGPWAATDLASISPGMAAIHATIERQCGLRIPTETQVLWD